MCSVLHCCSERTVVCVKYCNVKQKIKRVAIRLTKWIGNEIKKRKGKKERRGEGNKYCNFSDIKVALSQQVTARIMISPVSQCSKNAKIKQNSLRPVNSTPPQIMRVCSRYSQLCGFACENTQTSTPTYVSKYLFGITYI